MACELHRDDFWYPEIDRWSAVFLQDMELLAELVRKKKFTKEKLVNIKKELKKDINDFLLRSAWIEERGDELQEILSLPYWKKRYELYSAWISTQIIESLKDRAIEYHVVNGMLSFSFNGSLIATCRGLQPPLEIWTEKRTKAARLISKYRKSGIQPDYTLAIGSADTPENSIAVVECKQYKTPGTQNFREAIIDYANGRKNAEILLVNYGPVSLDKLNIEDTDIKNRSSCVEYMKPDSRTVTAFKEQLRKKVITYYQSHAQKDGRFRYPWTSPGSECSIKLSWKEIPSDLDLHLRIGGEANGNFHIYYAEMGQRKEIPYAVLDRDVKDGWGPEVIKKPCEPCLHFPVF